MRQLRSKRHNHRSKRSPTRRIVRLLNSQTHLLAFLECLAIYPDLPSRIWICPQHQTHSHQLQLPHLSFQTRRRTWASQRLRRLLLRILQLHLLIRLLSTVNLNPLLRLLPRLQLLRIYPRYHARHHNLLLSLLLQYAQQLLEADHRIGTRMTSRLPRPRNMRAGQCRH